MSIRLLSLIVVGVALAGCGKQEDEGHIIRFSSFAFPEYDQKREALAREFEAVHPDVKIRYEPISGDFYTKMITMIAAGTEPDIFVVGDYPLYVRDGLLLDITDYVKNDPDQEFFTRLYPQLLDAVTTDGRIHGLVSGINLKVLFYNKNHFDAAGMQYPNDQWTWEDMQAAAEKLTMKNADNAPTRYGLVIPYNEWHIFIHQNGGRIWSEDRTRCIINSPETRQAMLFLYALFEHKRLGPSLLNPDERTWQEAFRSGRASMYLAPTWNASVFKHVTDFQWSVAVLPRKKVQWTECSLSVYGISQKTRNPEKAYELLKHLTSPSAVRTMVEFGATIPIRQGNKYNDYFRNDPTRPNGEADVYLHSLTFAGTMSDHLSPYVPRVEHDKIMKEELDPFLLGTTSIEQALKKLEQRLNEVAQRNLPTQ